MRRKTFDALLTAAGLALTVILIVAGALLTWGYSYVSNEVHSQLSQQQIYFPPKAAFAHAKPGTEITPGMKPYLLQYAGQQLVNGTQAEAYANHFIAVHLSEMPYGGVYAKVSAAAQASPKNPKLAALEQTSFQGTTLRGLLLNAYAFWQIGQIMLVALIVAYAGGCVMLVLSLLGIAHLRRAGPDAEVLPKLAAHGRIQAA